MKDTIQKGRLENNIYYLPDIQLDRKEYLKCAKHLKFLGGKWNRNKKGFVFDRDIESIEELLGDNIQKQKEIQFFETPEKIADYIVELAEIGDNMKVLEPSAGRGAIIKSIKKVFNGTIDYCEIDPINRKYLEKIDDIHNLSNTGDFLDNKSLYFVLYFDRIIANPPFSKNQDIDHIRQMYSVLSAGGILVSIASKHWQISTNKKETAFRQWLDDVGAEIIELPEKEFKESGTNIATTIIKIKKY